MLAIRFWVNVRRLSDIGSDSYSDLGLEDENMKDVFSVMRAESRQTNGHAWLMDKKVAIREYRKFPTRSVSTRPVCHLLASKAKKLPGTSSTRICVIVSVSVDC